MWWSNSDFSAATGLAPRQAPIDEAGAATTRKRKLGKNRDRDFLPDDADEKHSNRGRPRTRKHSREEALLSLSEDVDEDVIALDVAFAFPDRWRVGSSSDIGGSGNSSSNGSGLLKPRSPATEVDGKMVTEKTAQSDANREADAKSRAQTSAAAAVRESKHGTYEKHRKYTFKTRKHADERELTKKENKLLDMEQLSKSVYARRCCHKLGGARWCTMALDAGSVLDLRAAYVAEASEKQRLQFIIAHLLTAQQQAQPHEQANKRHVQRWTLFGVDLCTEGVRRAFGCGRKKLRRAIRSLRAGQLLAPVHGAVGRAKYSPQHDWVQGWLSTYFDQHCDDTPSARGVMRILPFYKAWPAVHEQLVKDFRDRFSTLPIQPKPPSFFVFERVRLQHFANVVRPRKGTQPSCSTCVAISAERERCDASQRKDLSAQMAKHARAHMIERRALQATIDGAMARGDTLVVRVDYTTPATLPHYVRCPKALSREQPLSIKVCGALVQGSSHADGLHLFLHSSAVKKDGNTVATELFDVIRRARDQHHKHLVLSFDNAAGEAKNSTVLSLCALLVGMDWFESVEIHQLEPGHTHTYLDALFSHVQAALRRNTLVSVADVVDALASAFKRESLAPSVTIVEKATDWASFFTASLEPLAGHSQPLGFRFARVGSGPAAPVRMFVRDNSEGEWLGYRRTTQPIVVLKTMPRGYPHTLPLVATSAADCEALQKTVKTALDRLLVHEEEAKELRRVIGEGTLGAQPLESKSEFGQPAVIARPKMPSQLSAQDVYDVRQISSAPASVQPPPRSAAEPVAAKPPVPLFFKPRVAVITNKPHELKKLRDAAQQQAQTRDSRGSGSRPSGGGSSAAASKSSAAAGSAAPAMSARPSPSPTRHSPRVSRPPTPSSPLVSWDSIDED